MPFCPNYGSPVRDNDKFCDSCGQGLVVFYQNRTLFASFPPKPESNFKNGVFIGGGLASTVIGVLMALSLNGLFWEETARLANSGFTTSAIYGSLSSVASFISLGVFIALFGFYFLVLGSLYQFNPTLRLALEKGERKARLTCSLILGGIILIAYTLNSSSFANLHS